MPAYYIWTIGCQMNKADSEYMANHLEQAGYSHTDVAEEADIIVLNSCVVRGNAESKVVNRLDSLKGIKKKLPDVTIILTGCMVDSRLDDLKRRFPWVDMFFQPQQWEFLHRWTDQNRLFGSGKAEDSITLRNPAVTAFVPIIHGCGNFCSYCIVPYRRGRARSREVPEISSQVRALAKRGVKEVTLLGQIVDLYGYDLPSSPDLADLLMELNMVEGLLRIRFLTNHPNYMSHRLMQTVASLEKVCEHVSVPVQAGDSEILRLMRRGYNVEQYCSLVADIRSCIPKVSLSTDVIVGFPGETEKQFTRTMDILRDLRFDKVHVAAYSPRPGTIASLRLKDDVSLEQKELRRMHIESLQRGIAGEINADLVGQTAEVLVEGLKRDRWWGRTRGDKLVFFTGGLNLVGRLAQVRIDRSSPFALQGVLEEAN